MRRSKSREAKYLRHSGFIILSSFGIRISSFSCRMTPAQLQTIEEIFYAALDQEPDDVARFLETACEGDELLRRKVEALLASRQRVGSFIETSAAGIATRIIENGQADLLVGQTFGHYKISKRIGSGGMGEVYLATDVTAGRKAALKLLPMRFTGDAEPSEALSTGSARRSRAQSSKYPDGLRDRRGSLNPLHRQ